MVKVLFDFDLDLWIQDVEVEATSIEEAKEILYNMSVSDMIESGYIKDYTIRDVDFYIEDADDEE